MPRPHFVINSQTLLNVYGDVAQREKRKSTLITIIGDKGVAPEARQFAKDELSNIHSAEKYTMERQSLHYAFRVSSMVLNLLGGVLAMGVIAFVTLFLMHRLDISSAEGIFLTTTVSGLVTFFMGVVIGVYAKLGIDIKRGMKENKPSGV